MHHIAVINCTICIWTAYMTCIVCTILLVSYAQYAQRELHSVHNTHNVSGTMCTIWPVQEACLVILPQVPQSRTVCTLFWAESSPIVTPKTTLVHSTVLHFSLTIWFKTRWRQAPILSFLFQNCTRVHSSKTPTGGESEYSDLVYGIVAFNRLEDGLSV